MTPPAIYIQEERKKDPIFNPKVALDDYASAASYLSLLFPDDVSAQLIVLLKKAPVTQLRVNDILRASKQGPADPKDVKVQREIANIKAEQPMSPVLLVQGDRARGIIFTIADGYHRLSAIYSRDPDAMVSCQLARPNWSALDRPHQ